MVLDDGVQPDPVPIVPLIPQEQQETGDPIPQDVAGYRAAVRAASDAAEAAVQALDNVEAVQAYTVNWPAQVV